VRENLSKDARKVVWEYARKSAWNNYPKSHFKSLECPCWLCYAFDFLFQKLRCVIFSFHGTKAVVPAAELMKM